MQHPDRATGVIHCMAHSPEIFFRLPSISRRHTVAPFFRAADDFYPENPASHASQVVACAFNSLIFRHVACPDWDMFTTNLGDKLAVQMHAIARCLSGGPIYISDAPDSIPNLKVLEWISCLDGSTLPCRDSAVPIRRCLLRDPLNSDEPLVICNTNGCVSSITNGVLGVFYVSKCGEWDAAQLNYVPHSPLCKPLENKHVSIYPKDVPGFCSKTFANTRFLSLGFFSQSVSILEQPQSAAELTLSPRQSEAVAILPLVRVGCYEVAALGIEGKINGAGSLLELTSSGDSSVRMKTVGCGTFVVAVLPSINNATVVLDGQTVMHRHLRLGGDRPFDVCEQKAQVLSHGFSLIEFDVPPSATVHDVEISFY